MTQVPDQVVALVETFTHNYSAYKSGAYKEEQLKQEFLNPFFEALGWDVNNTKKKAAPQYRDVIFEDSIKVATGIQAPDYCFTLAGAKKFFVEAKKPSIDVQNDTDAIYQLRTYAWSAKLPLSILTNFEYFAVYEPRRKPLPQDKPSAERVKILRFDEYVDKWDEIAGIFSWNAVLQGSFDKFAEDKEKKRGTQEVGDEFLAEIEGWRDSIAKNIAIRNPSLSIYDLNDAVQKTIDRIVFLRMCEARGIERFGQLQDLLCGDKVYERLGQIYKRSDEKYNSGLFHFEREKARSAPPDTTTLGLSIDDSTLKDIIRNLYYPNSPYQFSVIPPEILGNIYECFLGKVIRLTEGHRAKVEEKPEVKKAGGVYYTPTYIVEHIVGSSIGRLCKGRTPKAISELRLLDPSCGSGSFLLGAYTRLLNYHQEYYSSQAKPEKFKDQIYQGKGGDWFLTIKEKKRILLNNIYGVDIDPQAVEVTKLSLLLKVLEGENKDVFERQQKLYRDRALPDLDNNIKCGNSLVDPDFYRGGVQTTLDMERVYHVNAFDWGKEFPDVMARGGFDVVIGNPPYVRQEKLGEFKNYFESHFQVFSSIADLYSYFIERGYNLLRDGGIFSYIVGNKWMRAGYGEPLREWLGSKNVDEVIDFGSLPVFKQATTYPCIIHIVKSAPSSNVKVTQVKTLEFRDLTSYADENAYTVPRSTLSSHGWTLADEESLKLTDKIRAQSRPLGEYVGKRMYYGVKTALNEAFVVDTPTKNQLIAEDPRSEDLLKPFLVGKDIKRYAISDEGRYLIFMPNGWTRSKAIAKVDYWKWLRESYPAIARHLSKFEDKARLREDQGEFWWELRPCAYYDVFERPKIVWPGISKEITAFALDEQGFYGNDNNQIIASGDLYLLGILNSSLSRFVLRNTCDKVQGGFYRLKIIYIQQIPIRTIMASNPADVSLQRNLERLVKQMIGLQRTLMKASTDHERSVFRRQILATDGEIDDAVYALYGLTPSEAATIKRGGS